MADLSNNSFIPKRGPTKRSRGQASRQVYMFTLVSYVLMFATLLAVGGVFLYSKYLDQQLNEEIVLLNTEIDSFSESDMQRVLEFNQRLQQASGRLDKSVSMVSVFEALEAATINTVKLKTLDLEREDDEKFILAAAVETDSFDSTIFQRGVYQRNQIIDSVSFSEVRTVTEEDGEEDGVAVSFSQPFVIFKAEIEVPLAAVPYVAREANTGSAPITITESALEAEIEPASDDLNEETI